MLIPARNEEKHIEETLRCLSHQGYGHKIILVDDESTDGTSDKAIKLGIKNLQLVNGRSPPKVGREKYGHCIKDSRSIHTSRIAGRCGHKN